MCSAPVPWEPSTASVTISTEPSVRRAPASKPWRNEAARMAKKKNEKNGLTAPPLAYAIRQYQPMSIQYTSGPCQKPARRRAIRSSTRLWMA